MFIGQACHGQFVSPLVGVFNIEEEEEEKLWKSKEKTYRKFTENDD